MSKAPKGDYFVWEVTWQSLGKNGKVAVKHGRLITGKTAELAHSKARALYDKMKRTPGNKNVDMDMMGHRTRAGFM